MKGKEQFVSYMKQVWIQKILYGFLMIAAGIIGVFPNIVCSSISAILVFVAVFIVYRKVYANPHCEEEDEMAETNMLQAECKAQSVIRLISMYLVIALLLIPDHWMASWDWKDVIGGAVFAIFGAQDVLTGFCFKRLEEA